VHHGTSSPKTARKFIHDLPGDEQIDKKILVTNGDYDNTNMADAMKITWRYKSKRRFLLLN